MAAFTADGLWPDYNDGSWPSCCTNADFDINEVIIFKYDHHTHRLIILLMNSKFLIPHV